MEIIGGMYQLYDKSICKCKIFLSDEETLNNVGVDLSNKLINKITQSKSAISGMGLLWMFKQFLIKVKN